MKAKIRILLAVVLAVVLCISTMMPIIVGEETELPGGEVETADIFVWMEWEAATKDDADIEITYDTTDNGNNHYTMYVILENMTDERIDNWEIWVPVNYEIQNIWNARIIDHYDNKYTIHNAEWNQDIPVGGSVSFGMTVTCSDKPEIPWYVYTTTHRQDVRETDYKVEFRNYSRGTHKFTGRIIITNKKEERLEDWGIDMDSNFKITKIQGAVLVDQFGPDFEGDHTHQEIENPGSGQNIESGESAEFEFTAVCDGEPKISGLKLNEVTSNDNSEDEDDEDDLEYVDEFILDSDYFETREEYEKYLKKHGLTDDALIELG